MPKLLVYERFAYVNDDGRRRHGMFNGEPADSFAYSNAPPEELWREEGRNGSMLTAEFQAAIDAFQMGGIRMAKIDVVIFED